jgi:arylsulfatase A-like enzyme
MPAMISWAGRIPQNEVRDQLTHACDWLPTLAELTQVKLPAVPLDGRSFVSVIRDARSPSPHVDHPLHWQVGGGPNADWAVREGDWKLIGNTRDTTKSDSQAQRIQNFLVNLKSDPGEKTNLIETHPQIADQLRKLHESHLK